ncbi:diaminopimelate decarboxylase [Halalkalibacillus halophilus]|uniref:diaminopimelate decarboxylase n=1 Tax=Halalkalibacillus halophilus TaxID=392827 RepID=UPI00042051AE|nr:diaminopimelate decarboxylase [Halalkalibacillus halophilus]
MTSSHLHFGGLDTVQLFKKYGSPLFIYDITKVREQARTFVNAFEKEKVKYQVAYASKAFSSIAILQVMKQEGLSLDVVSEGELHTAIQADYPAQKIHLHGNNKSVKELEMALEYEVGCIVIDNFHEIKLLEHLLKERNQQVDVLIRITPGIEAHTHDYILTGQEDSKFGFDLASGQADHAIELLQTSKHIQLKGIHSHIGSQIFETTGFKMAIDTIYQSLANWKEKFNFHAQVVNVGGGFGIKYTGNDDPLPLSNYVTEVTQAIRSHVQQHNLEMPEIWIEPGRSLVGEAGITLYEVGSIKDIPGVRKYVSVDGGMTDNIRPALYQAEYEAVVANKYDLAKEEEVSIAGKCCETGDMLIWDLDVPSIESGDVLAVFSTGAYNYAMSSNYNRFPKAAIVFIEDGKDQLVVQRESFEDLTRFDLSYEK